MPETRVWENGRFDRPRPREGGRRAERIVGQATDAAPTVPATSIISQPPRCVPRLPDSPSGTIISDSLVEPPNQTRVTSLAGQKSIV